MFSLIRGEDATVVRRVKTGSDGLGDALFDWVPEPPTQVLVTPRGSSDLDASRPDGVATSLTLHFEKSYQASLRGCLVRLRGREYRVIGDPEPYTAANVPGPYNRPVEVEAVDG